MKQQLEEIRKSALSAIENAGVMEDLEAIRVKYIGKKGELTAVLKQMGSLSAEERPAMGQLANEVRAALVSHGLRVAEKKERDGWVAFAATR